MKFHYISSLVKAYITLGIAVSLTSAEWNSPWGYSCDTTIERCVKEEITSPSSYKTLNFCKLMCGEFGALWPKPTGLVSLGVDGEDFLPNNITHEISAEPEVTQLLEDAIEIFKQNLLNYYPPDVNVAEVSNPNLDPKILAHVLHLDITVSGYDTRLTLETDESYSLTLTLDGDLSKAEIVAATFFGARHALESLSQLIDYDEFQETLMILDKASITDSPVFAYRGIILDTARNYFSLESIKRTLDGMASNKLNTFHWHITDSQSFPLVVESLPKMSYYGAYNQYKVYRRAEIAEIVEYGRVRGIRVLPEFDAPAHVGNGFQWGDEEGLGHLAVCVNREPWASYCVEPPCGQLNLANPNIYDVIAKIYEEMLESFGPIDLFHFGGDEVNLNCWNTTQEVIDWMVDSGFGLDDKAYYQQWSEFQKKVRELLIKANHDETVPGILWTSHLTDIEHVTDYVPKDEYIIQIWTTGDDPIIKNLLDEGYRLIFSNWDHWYLDCGMGAWVGEGNNWCSPYKGWQTVYDNQLTAIGRNSEGKYDPDLIIGGEAALWTEQVDEHCVDGRLWPRGAALGERLWSNPEHNWRSAEYRFIHHRQRMVTKGIEVDRIQPEWCHQNMGLCYA